jgi:hypothetical protein
MMLRAQDNHSRPSSPLGVAGDAGILRATPIKGLSLQRSLGHSIGQPQSRAATAVAGLILELIRDMVANGDWANASLLPQSPENGFADLPA